MASAVGVYAFYIHCSNGHKSAAMQNINTELESWIISLYTVISTRIIGTFYYEQMNKDIDNIDHVLTFV